MKVPLRWLREFIPISLETRELLSLFLNHGVEVKDILVIGEPLKDFIICRVREIKDNKVILTDGQKSFSVSTISYHLQLDDRVAYNPQKQLLLSPKYLGFADDTLPYILEPNWEVGLPVLNYLDDEVLDLEILPNRADLMSILGVARELSSYREITAVLKIPQEQFQGIFRLNKPLSPNPQRIEEQLLLEVTDQNACPDYIARMINDVKVFPSPFLMQWRLYAAGLRPINNIVDATNYIMVKYGTPLHAFDYQKITNHKIIVRYAQKGEKLKSIGGELVELSPEVLLIADERYPLALAGIIGGAESEIGYETQDVVLECARFNPGVIRKGRKLLKLTTEAQERFEMGIDPEILETASYEASILIAHLSYGVVASGKLEARTPVLTRKISLNPQKVNKILGIELDSRTVGEILKKLKTKIEEKEGSFLITVPSFRFDLIRDIDLIEEIARLYGYDNLPSSFRFVINGPGGRHLLSEQLIGFRNFFAGQGFYECYTISFCDEKGARIFVTDPGLLIKLPQPLNERYAYLRPSLLATLLEVVHLNLARGNKNLRLFEIGKIFSKTPQFEEQYQLALAICGERTPIFWQTPKIPDYELYDLKGILETFFEYFKINGIEYEISEVPYLENSLSIKFADRVIGDLGALSPEVLNHFDLNMPVWVATINLEEILGLLSSYRYYQPLPKFPALVRDFAFVLSEEISPQEIVKYIKEVGGALLTKVEIFDYYKGKPLPEGKCNLGIRLTLQSRERTLSQEEANRIFNYIIGKITEKWSMQIRAPE
jgi:phenylalanyl-tRNA synthetase beta chain